MAVELINPQRCENCGHARINPKEVNNVECREGPPSIGVCWGPDSRGQPTVVTSVTLFPTPGKTWSCSRWKPRLITEPEKA